MHGYELSNFRKGKAFIHFDGVINGKFDYGPRICINTKGEKLFELPDRDMFVSEFEDEDVAFVSDKNGLHAVMDNKGRFLTDFVYNTIYGGSEEGFFEVRRNGKHGHIDINGKEVVPCIYDDGSYFSGMIDAEGSAIIPFEYKKLNDCREGIIWAKNKKGENGFFNRKGEIVIPFGKYSCHCSNFQEGFAIVNAKGQGNVYIDKAGNILEIHI